MPRWGIPFAFACETFARRTASGLFTESLPPIAWKSLEARTHGLSATHAMMRNGPPLPSLIFMGSATM
jgi:hypothetical protein